MRFGKTPLSILVGEVEHDRLLGGSEDPVWLDDRLTPAVMLRPSLETTIPLV